MESIEPPIATPPQVMTLNTTPAPPTVPVKKSPIPLILTVVSIIVGILSLCAVSAYFLYVKPKVTLIQTSKKINSSILPVKTQIKTVNTALKNMYDLITNQNQPKGSDNTLLRLNVDNFIADIQSIRKKDFGQVAGAKSSVNALNSSVHEFALSMESQYNTYKQARAFGGISGKVLGTTTLESKRITMFRQLKEYAKTGGTSASDANATLTEFQQNLGSMIDANLNTDLYTVLKKLSTNNMKAQSYLAQANKTTSYYDKLADIQIKLEPTLTSYVTLIKEVAQSSSPDLYIDRIKEIETTLTGIDKEIKGITANNIPEGMESLHADNVKVVEILLTNVQAVEKSLVARNFLTFLQNVVLVSQQLEPIATRSISSELTFWQNNTYLRDGNQILSEYDKQAGDVRGIIEKNKVPYFTES